MKLVVVPLTAAALLWMVPHAQAELATAQLQLSPDKERPPVNAPGAGGTGTMTLRASANGVFLDFNYTPTGLTGPQVAAHVHQGPLNASGGVLVDLSNRTQGSVGPFDPANADDAMALEAMLTGNTYLNVHTAANGAGEVRDQLRFTSCACNGNPPTKADSRAFKKCIKTTLKTAIPKKPKDGESKDEAKTRKKFFKQYVKAVRKIGAKTCKENKGKKTSSCCLTSPIGVATGRPCAPVKAQKQCDKLGGQFVENAVCSEACTPVPSPSGAFLSLAGPLN